MARRELDLTIRSPALGGDRTRVRLLTPRGWTAHPRRRWPVLYLLHGCCDTYEAWTRSTDIARWPELHDTLVVMPDGGDVGFYSDWHAAGGPAWERYHTRELPSLLERGYGAGTPRAVAGLSMGGLGAMGYAARHPGTFAAAASFSGLLDPVDDRDVLLGLFGAYTRDPTAVWGDPVHDRADWEAHDPTHLAPRLRGTRLFVSAGDGRRGALAPRAKAPDATERTVGRESRAFVGAVRRAGLPVTVDFYGRGTHSWPYWRRELRRALPVLLGGRSAPPQSAPAP